MFIEVTPGGRHTILLGNIRKINTIGDTFDLRFDKDMFSLIETKTNEKIRKRIEALTKNN